MANKQAYNVLAPHIEDSIAAMLTGRDDLLELWLWLRAQERRGKFDPDDAAQAQRHLANVRRGLEEGLRLAREWRGDPLGEGAGE